LVNLQKKAMENTHTVAHKHLEIVTLAQERQSIEKIISLEILKVTSKA
jgi:hypothetical protein